MRLVVAYTAVDGTVRLLHQWLSLFVHLEYTWIPHGKSSPLGPSDDIWHHGNLVNIDSGNGLMPDGTTPLQEPMLTYYHLEFCGIQLGLNLYQVLKIESLKWAWKLHFSQETIVVKLCNCQSTTRHVLSPHGNHVYHWPVASFTKEVNPWLAKRPLVFNGRLANRGLTSLVKETTISYLTRWVLNKMATVLQTPFQIHFVEKKNYIKILRKFVPERPIGYWFSIRSDKREGELWGLFCEFKLWSWFCFSIAPLLAIFCNYWLSSSMTRLC